MTPRPAPADPFAAARGVAPSARGVADRGTEVLLAQADGGVRRSFDGGAPPIKVAAPVPASAGARKFTRDVFASALRNSYAIALSRGFKFGRAVGAVRETGRLPAIYDHDLFILRDIAGGAESRLELLSGKTSSAAIDAIFVGTKSWSFDCSEFSEIAQLFALRRALGTDDEGTKQFNELVKKGFRSRENAEGRLWISPTASLTFLQKQWFAAPLKDNNYAEGDLVGRKGTAPGQKMSQDAAKYASVGSLVTFVNIREATSQAWKHENAISLGDNRFVAWGIGIVEADVILKKLSENSRVLPKDQKGTIFIGGVSVPDLPFL